MHSTRSSSESGNSRPFGVAPTACPARPTRWSIAEISLGEPIWQTRSMSPMSMPSSSEEVATSALSWPSFSRCSARSRCSLERLPWWVATFSAPTRSARCRVARSARRRLLTKISVVRCAWTSSASRSYSSPQTSFDMIASSGERGSSSARSRSRTWPVSTISAAAPRVPTRKRAMSSSGFTVAERPTRTGGLPHSASSRSRDNIRCEPRLEPATECSSSTITLRTLFSIARPDSEVSRMKSDSGVVTRMCGGVLRMRLRSKAEVSPVRTASRIGTSSRPCSRSWSRMPASGSWRFFWMSFESALSGET